MYVLLKIGIIGIRSLLFFRQSNLGEGKSQKLSMNCLDFYRNFHRMSLSTYQKRELFEIISISFRFTLGYIMNCVNMFLLWPEAEDGIISLQFYYPTFLNQAI